MKVVNNWGNRALKSVIVGGLLFSFACKKDDSTNPDDNNNTDYVIPTTYTFTDKAGNNTVSFQGQLDRQKQLVEMMTQAKATNTAGTAIGAIALKDMFSNKDGNGGGNFSFVSTKQIKDKTAGNDPVVIGTIEGYMDSLATLSATTRVGVEDGGPGKGGIVRSGTKAYLQSATGIEYAQMIEKTIMTATFYYQITQGYLSPEKIGDQVDNTTPVVKDGVNLYYTTMEHHWDEAFGYFSTRTDFPTHAKDSSIFLAKYANSRDAVLGSNKKIMDAFLKGRAAIANKDLPTKNAMVEVIKKELERVVAGSAIHYLNEAGQNLGEHAIRNHVLSESVAFINGLRFGRPAGDPINGTLNTVLGLIGTDLYVVKKEKLVEARDVLSAAIGMDDVKNEL